MIQNRESEKENDEEIVVDSSQDVEISNSSKEFNYTNCIKTLAQLRLDLEASSGWSSDLSAKMDELKYLIQRNCKPKQLDDYFK